MTRPLLRRALATAAASAALFSVSPAAAHATGGAPQQAHHRRHHCADNASTLRITGGDLRWRPAAAFGAQLGREDITVAPVGRTSQVPDGFAFPVVAGRLATRTFAGRAIAVGGLRFATSGHRVTLRGPVLSTRDGVLRIGVGDRDDQRLALLLLSYRDADIRRQGRTLVERGLVATLTRAGARLLDARLHTTTFTAGERVGTVTLRALVAPACGDDLH